MKKVIRCTHDSNRYKYTDKLLEMLGQGVISSESVLQELLWYLPSDTVEEFASSYVGLDEE